VRRPTRRILTPPSDETRATTSTRNQGNSKPRLGSPGRLAPRSRTVHAVARGLLVLTASLPARPLAPLRRSPRSSRGPVRGSRSRSCPRRKRDPALSGAAIAPHGAILRLPPPSGRRRFDLPAMSKPSRSTTTPPLPKPVNAEGQATLQRDGRCAGSPRGRRRFFDRICYQPGRRRHQRRGGGPGDCLVEGIDRGRVPEGEPARRCSTMTWMLTCPPNPATRCS
jgi:hypothetical protein